MAKGVCYYCEKRRKCDRKCKPECIKKEKMRHERLLPNGIPKNVRCYDNGGKILPDKGFPKFYTDPECPENTTRSPARYTIVLTNFKSKFYWCATIAEWVTYNNKMYQTGYHSGHDKPIDRPSYKHLGKRIKFQDLPKEEQPQLINWYKENFNLKHIPKEKIKPVTILVKKADFKNNAIYQKFLKRYNNKRPSVIKIQG